MHYSRALLFLSTLLLTLSALAAQAVAQLSDPCGCDAVLMGGVYSYRYARGDNAAESFLNRYFAQTTWDEFQQKNKASGGISVPGYFGASFAQSKDAYEKHQQAIKTGTTEWNKQLSTTEVLEQFGDKNVLDTFATCKATCSKEGLFTWIQSNDLKTVVFHLKWEPRQAEQPPMVERSTLENGTASDFAAFFTKDRALAPKQVKKFFISRANDSAPIKIAIQFSQHDSVAEYVPPIILTKEPPPSSPSVASVPSNALRSGDTIYIKTRIPEFYFNSHDSKGKVSTVRKNAASSLGRDEEFTLQKLAGDGPIFDETEVYFRTSAPQYYLNSRDSTGAVSAVLKDYQNNRTLGKDEVFRIKKVFSSGPLVDGDAVYIKTSAGFYLNSHASQGDVKAIPQNNPNPGESDEIFWIKRK